MKMILAFRIEGELIEDEEVKFVTKECWIRGPMIVGSVHAEGTKLLVVKRVEIHGTLKADYLASYGVIEVKGPVEVKNSITSPLYITVKSIKAGTDVVS